MHAFAIRGVYGALKLGACAGQRGSQALKLKGIDRTRSLELLNHMEQHIDVDATMDECYTAAVGFEDYPKWAGD